MQRSYAPRAGARDANINHGRCSKAEAERQQDTLPGTVSGSVAGRKGSELKVVTPGGSGYAHWD